MKSFPLLLVAAVLGATSLCAAQNARPNILFIAVDDLNDWVGFLKGHPQTRTPNMDRLAARGVVFANAHCAAPLCGPSRAAVFSGRQPFRSGVYGNEDDIRRIAPNLVLIPQQLKAHGYRVLGTGKLLHQRRPDLFDDTFTPEQRWSPFESEEVNYTPEELPSKRTDNPRHVVRRRAGQPDVILPLNRMPSERAPDRPGGESFDWGPLDVPDEAMGDTQIADWAVKQLRAPVNQPFFLGVGFYRPHIPLFAPSRYFEPFAGGRVALPAFRRDDLDDLGATAKSIALDPVTAGTHAHVLQYDQWKAAVAAYLACVHFVDAQVGKLLDALDASPHRDTTIIVLWGDHGWHLGEKQHWGKWTGWDRATRVPLLIVPPTADRTTFARGQTSREPASLIDLYPTLLELCGVPAPANRLDGTSLVALLKEPARRTERAVISTFYAGHFSVRDVRWRYIRYADGTEELYDHQSDPNEWHNLASQPPHQAVKTRLAREIPSQNDRAPISPPPPAKRGKQ
jgi:arylsulfatase A-like enzyme